MCSAWITKGKKKKKKIAATAFSSLNLPGMSFPWRYIYIFFQPHYLGLLAQSKSSQFGWTLAIATATAIIIYLYIAI